MSDSDEAAVIRPSLSEAQVVELVGRLYGLKVSKVKPLPSYMDQNFHVLVCETQEGGDHGESYVLKVLNTDESQDTDLVEAQTRVMMFLNQKGFPTATPITTIDGKIMSLETIKQGSDYKQFMIRLLTYLPGVPMAKFTLDHQICYKLGRTIAQMDKALHEEFYHPTVKSLHRDGFMWNLSNTHLLERHLHEMEEGEVLSIIEQVIQQFKEKIRPNLDKFHKGLIYGDCNEYNILLEPLDSPIEQAVERTGKSCPGSALRISGILDFGDMSFGCFVQDLAITVMYLTIISQDPVGVGGHVIAGFESVIPLTEEERDSIYLLVFCRFSQSMVMARHNMLLDPDNAEYLNVSMKVGSKRLRQLWQVGKEVVEKVWFDTAKSYLQ
ncbi:hydroxylysine kinase-like [Leucoraja erinacea]|uniref:hydroxylysine kinase-like n=1 Tax=Leucoraja erinaceus TaxID=7782 RepID=UPI002457F6D9|nr:hydroxylysine kinase-like [Leucoraja erinacea]XP_055518673.1 hydroxylysine kinase-like [Leucoraja erinacea]